MGLKERWEAACAEVAAACEKYGRDAREVKVLAVSKTVEAPVIAEAISCGMTDFGENRVKPFAEKRGLYPRARWHFIGSLQSNKAAKVAGAAHLVHSLDHDSLLCALERAAAAKGVVQDVLVEVSVAGEVSKGGVPAADLPAFLERVAAASHLRCRGLMTMAPRGDARVARETFEGLRKLAENMAQRYGGHDTISMDELSMGMSEDYEQAIAEGSTMVRIGRRIFSEDFRPLARS